MNREMLEQYYDLKKELNEVRERISKTEEQLKRIESEGNVVDSVKGGSGGIQHFKIEGFPQREYSRKKTLLYMRKATQAELESEIDEMVVEVEKFISDIDDSHARRIINFRFVDGKSWEDVAISMGGSNSTEGVRKYFTRYMDKLSSK